MNLQHNITFGSVEFTLVLFFFSYLSLSIPESTFLKQNNLPFKVMLASMIPYLAFAKLFINQNKCLTGLN
jgi:hypothetical protein